MYTVTCRFKPMGLNLPALKEMDEMGLCRLPRLVGTGFVNKYKPGVFGFCSCTDVDEVQWPSEMCGHCMWLPIASLTDSVNSSRLKSFCKEMS